MKNNKNYYQKYIFPLAKLLHEETAHNLLLQTLHLIEHQPFLRNTLKIHYAISNPGLRTTIFGLRFENPIGIAAGFDKNAVAAEAFSTLGFGHIEIGTVTPIPQKGNPKPRLFRLEKDLAIINRFGFSNVGVEELKKNLSFYKRRNFVLGINVGPNRKSVEQGSFIEDFIICIQQLYKYGDYFTINISSPNTQGLRLLQAKTKLNQLLKSIFKTTMKLQTKKPLLVKIAPDLTESELLQILGTITAYPVAGVIATNTTIERHKSLKSKYKDELGGLSGKPLKQKSTAMIKTIYTYTKGKLPIIGVGGVFTADDAIEKIKAGASLVQVFTGFIYQGPSIAYQINQGLIRFMKKNKIKSVQELVGQNVFSFGKNE